MIRIISFFIFFGTFYSHSQGLSTDYGNYIPCSGPIAFYTFDFTATGSNTITQSGINIVNADNQCCSLPTNNGCLFFNVIVDPGATGVNFTQTGAGGSVVIYYDNCATQFGANVPICLNPANAYTDSVTGDQYHRFMFCRTGQTAYSFTFTQIIPSFPPDVGVTEGCTIPLSVQGLDPATITWTSIAPGATGAWDSLLNCTSGCLDVVVTPTTGSPPSVSYQVCGNLSGACNGQQYCDTVTVTIYPDLFAYAGPDMAFCLGSLVSLTSTGTAIGGTPAFTYTWNGISGNGIGFSYSTVSASSTATVDVTQAGVYVLVITDLNGCAAASDTMEVFEYVTDIETYIPSGNVSVCYDPTPTITISGYVTETETGEWSSSNGGTFGTVSITSPGAVAGVGPAVSTTWTPIPGTTGVVTLTLTPTNNAGCPITPATVDITLTDFTSTLSLDPTDVSCFGFSDGEVDVTVTDINGCTIASTITLTEPPALTEATTAFIYPSGENISCFGFNDGSIDLTNTGGSPAYSYAWTTLDGSGLAPAGEDQTGLTAGTYDVTVTDINGCIITSQITLIEPTPLVTSLTPSIYAGGWNTTGCDNDGSIDLLINGGVGGYIFDWSNDGTGDFDDLEDINSLFPGWYYLSSADINGCLIQDSIQLLAPPLLNTSISVTSNYNGEDVSCQGASDGSVEVVALDGTPGYTYEWMDASGTVISNINDPSGIPAGWYYVLTTDQNGCSANDSIEVVDAPPLISDILVSTDYNGQDISCFGASDGGIDFIIFGGTPAYTIVWLDGSNNFIGNTEDLNGLAAGFYSVIVQDANGCIVDTNITLFEPPILDGVTDILSDYNGQDISCFQYSDGSVDVTSSGGTPGYTYEWLDVNGTNIGNTPQVDNLPSGDYIVNVTDVNGCTIQRNITLTEPPLLDVSIDLLTDYFGLPVSCAFQEDGSIQAIITGGTPGHVYSWNTNPVQNTGIISNLGEGSYTVTVTDINGCVDSATVILDAHPIPIPNPDAPIEVCHGIEVVFNSNAGANESCIWTFDNSMVVNSCGPNVFSLQEVGCYDAHLVITNQFGCMDSISITDYICIRPHPVAGFYTNSEVYSIFDSDVNITNTSSGAVDYYWDFGDGETSEGENPYHQFPFGQPGYYEILLIATSQYGCQDSATKTIEIREELLIYVPNTFTPDGDQYNNTFKPVIGIGVSPEGYVFETYNRWGELIFVSHDPAGAWDGTYFGKYCQDGTLLGS
ncbi:MAG: PKD domain-containing protein [Crocinitomicaceae bacterium]